ncbi:CLM7 protein, partial [Pelecanoides urinatrix]|nr:CLM7 protein [Pelecanoides urinatrix]
LTFTGLQTQTPVSEESRSEGSTLYIQCPYIAETNYQQQKAWLRMIDNRWELLVKTTNPTQHSYIVWATEGKVTLEDNPTNKTVSITMTNLQAEDSGTYSCAYLSYSDWYILTKMISLNVFKELHKWELDSLSVRCPYSTQRYTTEAKAWCQKQRQTPCKVVVRTWRKSKALKGRTSIQDNTRHRTVTITMQKLQAQDTGVYWCALSRNLTRIMEVRLSVSKTLAGKTSSSTASTSQTTPSGNTPAPSSNKTTFILLSGVLSILFILALITSITLCVKRRKQLKRRGTRQAEDTHDKPEDIAQLDNTERMESPKDDSKDLKYVTLNFKSQLSSEDPLYCNVEPSQTHRKPKDESVEYATIALK